MHLYELSDSTFIESQWVVAPSIVRASRFIEWECDKCGRGTKYPVGDFDIVIEDSSEYVENGSQYPDKLLCGEYSLLILSNRVTSALSNAGVTSFIEYPVQVVGVQDTDVKLEAAPIYSHVVITGNCMVNLSESNVKVKGVCGRCGELEREITRTESWKLIEGSWDGSDLFRDYRYFPCIPFCSEKVVDVVRANGFTNFQFKRIE